MSHLVNDRDVVVDKIECSFRSRMLHGVFIFYMIVAIARVIGAILWEVIRVDNRDGYDC
ncbi:hypothetical protein GBA52_008569, partial [Prunus armeniaca]